MPPVVAVETGRTALRPAWIEPAVAPPRRTATSVGRSVSEPRLAGEEDRARHRRDGPGEVRDVVDERDLVADEVGGGQRSQQHQPERRGGSRRAPRARRRRAGREARSRTAAARD